MPPLLYESRLSLRPLRPRQERAIEEVRRAVREGHKRIVLQAPTGWGKTLWSAHLIAASMAKGKRPIFTCPAINLVEQTLKAFEAEGIHDIGIIQAQHSRTDWLAQLQIASVQTLIKRTLPDVDLILIDEVHLGWEKLNERLDSEEWKDKVAIGLSATPWQKGMGLRWTKLVIAATIQELIDEQHLCPFQVFVPNKDLDRSRIKIVHGEFQEKSASQVMSDAEIIGDIVETWKQKGVPKTFMFCVNRAHAKEQMDAFVDAGIPFGYMDAYTEMPDRKRIFAQMQYGEIAGIASVGTLIQGVDEDVRCLIDAAPTKSAIRHVQKIGRALRTADGKERAIILDHAGNNLALGLVTDIFHDHLDRHHPDDKREAYEGERKPPKPKKCPQCHAVIARDAKLCASCGGNVRTPSGVINAPGELVEFGLTAPVTEKFTPEDHQEWYSGFLGLAEQYKRSDGWVAHRFKEKFGIWPPKSLVKIPIEPGMKVKNFDRHCRIKWVKSQQARKAFEHNEKPQPKAMAAAAGFMPSAKELFS